MAQQHAAVQYVDYHMSFATKLLLSLVYISLSVATFIFGVNTTNQALKGSGMSEDIGCWIQAIFTTIESTLFFGIKGQKKHRFAYLAVVLDVLTNFCGLWKWAFGSFRNWEVLNTVYHLPLINRLAVNVSLGDFGDLIGFFLCLLISIGLAPITEFYMRETVKLWKSD